MSTETAETPVETAEPDETTGAAVGDDAAAEQSADSAAETAVERNRRKVREGIVTSTKMDATAVVSVTERVRHPRYFKTVQRTKKLYVHDPAADARLGDRVRVMETRPISKTKRWRLVEIVERAR